MKKLLKLMFLKIKLTLAEVKELFFQIFLKNFKTK